MRHFIHNGYLDSTRKVSLSTTLVYIYTQKIILQYPIHNMYSMHIIRTYCYSYTRIPIGKGLRTFRRETVVDQAKSMPITFMYSEPQSLYPYVTISEKPRQHLISRVSLESGLCVQGLFGKRSLCHSANPTAPTTCYYNLLPTTTSTSTLRNL